MYKMSADYVLAEMDKLYAKKIDVKDLDNHIQFMVDFLNSCGWTQEDYIRAIFQVPIFSEEMN